MTSWAGPSILLLVFAAGSALAANPVGTQLDQLVELAWNHNPRVRAARRNVAETAAAVEELDGFYDPRLVSAAGVAENGRSLPGVDGFPTTAGDRVSARVAITKALDPGVYVTGGVTEEWVRDHDSGTNEGSRTSAGVEIRVPLMRDRGFRQLGLRQKAVVAEFTAASARLRAVRQQVRHQVEVAFISVQQTLAEYHIAQEATKRFQTVVDDATELAEMGVVPEYQVFPARMELKLRLEEELQAERTHEVSLIRLRELLAVSTIPALAGGADLLVQWADEMSISVDYNLRRALEARGRYQAARYRLEAARVRVRRAEDELRPNLSVNARATWVGEEERHLDHTDHFSQSGGAEVLLVWTQPLGMTAERKRVEQLRQRVGALRQELRGIQLQLDAELETASVRFQQARKRFALVLEAVAAARKALQAEQERFRLGEARSRDVLDAQKDLTDAIQRQTRTASELLRAGTDFEFFTGYDMDALSVEPRKTD